MSTKSTIEVKVTDAGSIDKLNDKLTKAAQKIDEGLVKGIVNFQKELLKAASVASTSVPKSVEAARQGVANTNAVRSGGTPNNSNLGISGQGETKTARSIGAGAGTGSATSDFAAQAQGLGGLVHVYATFAANIFAVSAAFNALSKAFDTANMVKGLDQLGATSGRALGALSKQLVEVTGGAINLRDAMTATALASSGGMTNDAILRLGMVAKQASQALGVAMPDAINRLSKGIVKVQPELLDELGIMTRVIPAQQAYAASVGKTVSTLTDFEKRQAFANAVLTEGEKKFNSIKIDANPYSKILASLENLLFVTLDVINKGLGPLVNILSSSPTALAVAVGGFATLLLKQAIPTLGAYRKSMQDLADNSYASLLRVKKDQQAFAIEEDIRLQTIAANKFKNAKETEAMLAKISFTAKSKGAQDIVPLTKKNPFDLSTQEIAKIQDKQKMLADSNFKTYNEDAIRLQNYLDKTYAIRAKAENVAAVAADANEAKDAARFSHQSQLQKIVDKETQSASNRRILAAAAESAATLGPARAWKQLNEDIAKSKAGGTFIEVTDKLGNVVQQTVPATGALSNGFTRLKGALGIATTAVSTFVGAFSTWLLVAGIIIEGLSLLSTWLSKNTEQYDKFIKTVEAGTDSLKLAKDVLSNLYTSAADQALSSQDIIARAGAIDTLSSSVTNQAKAYKELIINSNSWDRFTEGFWSFFGKGASDKLAKTLTEEVNKSVELLNTKDAQGKLQEKLSAILNIDPKSSMKDIDNAMKKLPDSADKGAEAILQIAKALKESSLEATKVSANLQGLNNSLNVMTRASADFNNSLLPTTGQAKFGESVTKAALDLGLALQNPITAVTALNELLKDSSNLSMFDEKDAAKLMGYRKELNAIGVQDKINISNIRQMETQLAALQEKQKQYTITGSQRTSTIGKEITTTKGTDYSKDIAEMKKFLNQGLSNSANSEKQKQKILSEISGLGNNVILNSFEKGAALIEAGLTEAATKAAVTIGQANLSGISGRGVAAESDRLRQMEIAGQKSVVDAMYENTLATTKLTMQYELSNLQEKAKTATGSEAEVVAKSIRDLESTIKLVGSIGRGTKRSDITDAIRDKIGKGEFAGAGSLNSINTAMVGRDIKLTELGAQSKASQITKRKGEAAEELANAIKLNSLQEVKNKLEQDSILSLTQYSGLFIRNNQLKLDELELSSFALKNNSAILAIEKDIKDIKDSGLANSGKLLSDKTLELTKLKEQQNIELSLLKVKQAANLAGKTAEQEILELKQRNELKSITGDLAKIQNSMDQSRLSALDSLGVIDKSVIEREKLKLDLQLTEISNSEALRKLEEDKLSAMTKITMQKAADLASPTGVVSADTLKEEERINNLYAQRKGLQDATNASAVFALQIAANTSIYLAKQNEQMALMVSATTDLTTIFGDLGASIGKVGETLLQMAQTDERYGIAKLDQTNKLIAAQAVLASDNSDPKDRRAAKEAEAEATERLAKLDKDRIKSELDGTSKVLGATKGLFDQKSKAYKALDAAEKVYSAFKLAMTLKEIILDKLLVSSKVAGDSIVAGSAVASASVEVAASTAVAGAEAVEGVVNQAGGDPYSAFPRMAAMAAIMAALVAGFSGDGGSGSAPTAGQTSADRQAVQGTGQSYDAAGNLVANGGGVFGDVTAKSESISKSLEILNATTVKGITYSNEMVAILTSINENIAQAAQNLYNTKGISSGTGFGTVEKSTSSPGFLGLFASSSSTSIIDSGIQLRGSFLDLAHSAGGLISAFETVQNTSTSSGFFGIGGGTSTSINTATRGLDKKTLESIQGIFSGAEQVFIKEGALFNKTKEDVISTLSTVQVDQLASLRGLKGQDLQDALNAVMSSIVDNAAEALFPQLKKFAKFGEGYAQTVARVLDTSSKIHDAFKQIGKTLLVLPETMGQASAEMNNAVTKAIADLDAAKKKVADFVPTQDTPGGPISDIDPKLIDDVTESEKRLAEARRLVNIANNTATTNNLALTEAMATAAGGLQEFLDLSQSFTDNYLSSTEVLSPKIIAIQEQMSKLGVSTSITKDSLKTLVLNYRVTDEASAKYYVELLKLAEAYNDVSADIANVTDKLGLSASGISSILNDAVSKANSVEEARALGSSGFADALGKALQSSLITSISSIIYDSVITPLITNIAASSGAAALNLVTGGVAAGTNLATGGAISGTNLATGGAVAGSTLADGGAAAANNMVAGGTAVSGLVQTAITKVNAFVGTFVQVLQDQSVQASLKELSGVFGDFAAAAYTGSSAITGLTTSIGGTAKAASGASSGGGSGSGATGAANDLASAWQSAADSIFKEVTRIRELMVGTGQQALDAAQAKFNAATELARSGDLDAAKLLPSLSAALLTTAEATTSTLLDLRKVQASTQSSLETTGLGAVATYGLNLPSYDIGTNNVVGDQIAMLHNGEAVIPKAYNPALGGGNSDEIKELSNQIANLTYVTIRQAEDIKKLRDVMVNVTENGKAIKTEVY